jgi:adenosylcobinamide-phosphate guanylyltransferase
MVPAETRERLGLKVDHVFEIGGRYLVPAGMNVIDARKIEEAELEEEKLVIDTKEIAVNVNRPEDCRAIV